MADKEERILISELRKYKGDTYKLTMFGDKDVLPVERVWQKCMTKQEAIEVMAKAMCRTDDKEEDCEYCIYYGTKNCETRLKKFYLDIAEAALNALLEGGK